MIHKLGKPTVEIRGDAYAAAANNSVDSRNLFHNSPAAAIFGRLPVSKAIW